MNNIIIEREPLSVHWSQPPVSKLLTGRNKSEALEIISRLFLLCGEAHRQAACRVLMLTPPEPLAAGLERVRETLRRLLLDWYPAFTGARAPEKSWLLMREKNYQAIAQQFIFGMQPDEWFALEYAGWLTWIEKAETPMAQWLRHLWPIQLDPFPRLCEWNANSCHHHEYDVSPLALEGALLPPTFKQIPAHRLLARCVLLARSLMAPQNLRINTFNDAPWRSAVVECARGWLCHRARLSADGLVEEYQILPPTAGHASEQGLIWHTLRQLPTSSWPLQLLLIDPCVNFSINGVAKDA